MAESILLLTALLCCILGMAWFALAKKTHWIQVQRSSEPSPATQTALRVLGTCALGGALMLCLMADHPSMAVLVWIMALAVGALVVTFTLTWKPSLLAPLIVGFRPSR